MLLRKVSDLEKTVATACAIFRAVYSEYHMAQELWEGLKEGDEGARLLLIFFCVYKKIAQRIAPSKKQSRQRERDGWML